MLRSPCQPFRLASGSISGRSDCIDPSPRLARHIPPVSGLFHLGLALRAIVCQLRAMAELTKSEQVRALRELRFARKSSDGVAKATNHRPSRQGSIATSLPDHGRSAQRSHDADPSESPFTNIHGRVMGQALQLPAKLKLGRPFKPETKDKPWIAAGMSRRTWYRRQAEKRAK